MRQWLAVWLVLVLTLSLGFGLAAAEAVPEADESLKVITDRGYLVLGLDDSFPPMGYRDANDQIVGFDIDLAREVTRRMGVELRLKPIEWSEKESLLNGGTIDCIWNGMSITAERLETMSMSVAYLDNDLCLLVKPDSGIQSLDDIAGMMLGLQSGSSVEEALDEYPDFRVTLGGLQSFEDNMAAMANLDDGKVDAVLLDKVVAEYEVAHKQGRYQMLSESLALEYLGIGFRKDDIALTSAVNDTLRDMAKDGKLAEISTYWFGSDVTTVSNPPDDPAFIQDVVVDEEDDEVVMDEYVEGFFEEDSDEEEEADAEEDITLADDEADA